MVLAHVALLEEFVVKLSTEPVILLFDDWDPPIVDFVGNNQLLRPEGVELTQGSIKYELNELIYVGDEYVGFIELLHRL